MKTLALLTCAAALVVLPLLLAGCVTLTPAAQSSLDEVRAFADETARVYGVPRVHVDWAFHRDGIPASYGRATLLVHPGLLLSQHRDAVVAHELGHYLLDFDRLPRADDVATRQRHEMDANAKAVEILVRARGLDELRAIGLVYDVLQLATGWNRTHASGCEEITDLLRRFPQHRTITAAWPCAPTDWTARP